jgi:hypothetical protein
MYVTLNLIQGPRWVLNQVQHDETQVCYCNSLSNPRFSLLPRLLTNQPDSADTSIGLHVSAGKVTQNAGPAKNKISC